jgi:hypothetical protein
MQNDEVEQSNNSSNTRFALIANTMATFEIRAAVSGRTLLFRLGRAVLHA